MPIDYSVLDAHPDQTDFDDLVLPVVRCDREVYGTDPSWREGKTCIPCTRTSDGPVKWLFSDAPDRCPTCGTETTDFWPVEGLLADYRAASLHADNVLVVAHEGESVVGAYHGWSMGREELDRHLNAGTAERLRAVPNVADTLRSLFPGTERFAYEASIFVLPDRQGRGIAGELTRMGQRMLWDRGLRVFTMRTKTYPHAATYPWYLKNGYRLVSSYPDADRRVVLARAHNDRP